jgi:hypothetical protein
MEHQDRQVQQVQEEILGKMELMVQLVHPAQQVRLVTEAHKEQQGSVDFKECLELRANLEAQGKTVRQVFQVNLE